MDKNFDISFEAFSLMPPSEQKRYFDSLTKSHSDLREKNFILNNRSCSNCKFDVLDNKSCLAGVERPLFDSLKSVEKDVADAHKQNCRNAYCCGIFWESKE